MCGIFGFNFEDKNLALKISEKLLHRGPDDSGIFIDDGLTLGHRRLSIIDLSERGRQPMFNEDGTLVLVFNGEIYNFKELKGELKENHEFISNTDSEVILHLYEDYGIDFINKLRGMFAFALYDMKKKNIILARDRIGKKPLYYYYDGNTFIFSSELPAILEAGVKKEISYRGLSSYLVFGFVQSPFTILKNVYKLEPGQILIYSNDGVKLKKYWDLNPYSYYNDLDYIVNRIRNLLFESVKLRMISDVPLGAFLSGGIDSSVIVYIMKKISESVKTYSIGFDFYLDESKFAEYVADYFNTEHKTFFISVDNAQKIFNDVISYLSEPINDPALIPVFLLSKNARRHVKVVLTGEGGDELFGGYERYRAIKFYLLPKFIKKIGINLILNKSKYFKYIKKEEKYRIISYMNKNLGNFYLSIISTFLPYEIKKMCRRLNFEFNVKFNSADLLNEAMVYDIKTSLADGLLMKVDFMTMANSLEARTPYLDHILVDFATRIPSNYKIKFFNEKYVLKKTFEKDIPKNIIKRKKQGFFVPINEWISKELKSDVEETLRNTIDIFDKYYIEKLIKKCRNPSLIDGKKIWSLYTFQKWREHHLR